MRQDEIERRIRDLRRPHPSDELRRRVFAAAPVRARAVFWSDRIWFSRAWRMSAIVVAIAAVGLEMMVGMRHGAPQAALPQTHDAASEIERAGRDAGLQPDVAQSLARRARVAARPVADPHASLAQALDAGGH